GWRRHAKSEEPCSALHGHSRAQIKKGPPQRASLGVKRWMRLDLSRAAHSAQDQEQHHRAEERHKDTDQIDPFNLAANPQRVENETADDTADDTDNDVFKQALAAVRAHDQACEPAGD